MRHHSKIRKFGRERNQRKALLRTLAVSLIDKEAITTTLPKAKELRPYVEKLVTKGKAGTLAQRRLALSVLGTGNSKAVSKLFGVLGPKYKERAGGYTRIVKMGSRIKDAAPMARISFV